MFEKFEIRIFKKETRETIFVPIDFNTEMFKKVVAVLPTDTFATVVFESGLQLEFKKSIPEMLDLVKKYA